jgi:hypothetical protein
MSNLTRRSLLAGVLATPFALLATKLGIKAASREPAAIVMELDPTGAPGVFTYVAELEPFTNPGPWVSGYPMQNPQTFNVTLEWE